MSITFAVRSCQHGRRDPWDCPKCESLFVNMANGNALGVMHILAIRPRFTGTIRARILAARCRRCLMQIDRGDCADEVALYEPGYLRHRVRQLLELALAARSGRVAWY